MNFREFNSTHVHVWWIQWASLSTWSKSAFFLKRWEDVPEPECFVTLSCSGHNVRATGRHAEVQDSLAVSFECGNLLHCWVFPDNDLVLWKPVGWNNFIGCFGEHQIANLAACVDVVDWLQSMSVPESDAFITCATSTCEKSFLVWVPSNSFDCGIMLTEFGEGLFTMKVPDHKFVIVSSAC